LVGVLSAVRVSREQRRTQNETEALKPDRYPHFSFVG
jgi:hypothetical protein